MRPCGLEVHIASSSLAHVWMANIMLLYLQREASQTARVMWPNRQQDLPIAFYLIDPLWQEWKNARKQRTQEHPPTIGPDRTPVHRHTRTQPISYLLADTHTPTQTLASITRSSPPDVKTLSYTSNRYICSACQISLTHATLILMVNSDYSDGNLHV